ncbi:MAG: MBL fold metallo-hydrolase [Acidobacteriota bacterium]|jgi:metallo-beta-lactamase family protein|nr:MBL fold metallo-hydrolase [Acidobacteriota bacterium]
MAIKLFSHGACREVTGSKHFLDIDGRLLQIDCGMFQGRRDESYHKNKEMPFDAREVQALILTHAHFDHSGALPILVKNGFQGNIYATSATRDIAQIILLDSAHIQQKDFEIIKEKAAKYPERKLIAYEPLYNAEEAVQPLRHFVTVDYQRKFHPLEDVTAEFFDAGHILGAGTMHLTLPGGLNVGFSGDLGRNGLPIIRDPEIMPPMDYLVLESTYGNRLHKSIGMAGEELAELIHKAQARRSKIIIPAFTIERTQELIYIIHTLQLEGKVPRLPIFIDSPMAVNATAIFKIHPECFDEETIRRFISVNVDPFGFENIRYVVSTAESKEINAVQGPAIIIAASGMAESGRILHHLIQHIENPDNIIAIVGFMAENTLGRRLAERAKEVRIFGKSYQVKAEIATLNAFSAHADYAETIDWLKHHDLQRLKKVFLVHGEAAALENLQRELLGIGIPQVEIVEYGAVHELN